MDSELEHPGLQSTDELEFKPTEDVSFAESLDHAVGSLDELVFVSSGDSCRGELGEELGECRGDLLGGAFSVSLSLSLSLWCGELGLLDSVDVEVLLVAVGVDRGYGI